MGTVYLARDLRHQRPVAIKVLNATLAAALGAERFLREIEIVARLSHPHIVPLIDSGEADGLLYFIMPFIADGLAYAHAEGVVHRDIKPENVLLAGGHAFLAWYTSAGNLAAAPDGGEVAFAGFDAATDTVTGLSVLSLSDGKITPWLTDVAEGSALRWLPDPSIMLAVEEPNEIFTLYRVRGPGEKERLGTIPGGSSPFRFPTTSAEPLSLRATITETPG